MKQRMMKAGILLLGLMIVFTMISRTAYNISTAEVSTKKSEPQTFTPDVSARGTVAGREEIAVSTVESLRVGSVHVMEGQAVEAGQLYGTVFNDSRGQARAILDLALALYSGEDPAQAVELENGHYVWLPYQQVTRENLSLLPAD